MNGITFWAISFSFFEVIFRVAIIAGMAQAKPESNGTKDLPPRPTIVSGLSIKAATRARYPEASNKPIPIKRINIYGTKMTTPPIAATNPEPKNSPVSPGIFSVTNAINFPKPPSIRSIAGVAAQ